jgi:hypothetical protein
MFDVDSFGEEREDERAIERKIDDEWGGFNPPSQSSPSDRRDKPDLI